MFKFATFVLLATAALASEFVENEEILVNIRHGGEQANINKLLDLGISSLEHPRLDSAEVQAYISKRSVQTLQENGFKFEVIPHETQLYHQQLARDTEGSFDSYHTYDELGTFLDELQAKYPTIARKFSIGTSVQGRELWGIRITSNPDVDESEPQFKYVANMHGDETVGRELLLELATLLCSQYAIEPPTNLSARITQLVDRTDIYLLPTMNPDGFALGRRSNAAGYDLNRNFPDVRFPGRETGRPQPEVDAVMRWSLGRHFVLSANFHGGAVVANYPYDGSGNHMSGFIEPTPDHALFQQLALVYSQSHEIMHASREFANGITNGVQWYALYGGMQDWNYLQTGCMEITVELSDIKYPQPHTLPRYWTENQESLLAYMEQVHLGIRGVVFNANKQPVNATVTVEGNEHKVFTGPVFGDYYRLIYPGSYVVTASADGFVSQSQQVNVPNNQLLYAAVELNFVLEATVPSSA
eukprot:TRINITY_DN9952_c0_g1_i1.p1 TRINITY_DN9952_c0_g1~~TRINITY_DN9952_c0_g1_i1.p1  ORF type:complete len:500 (+),score=134.88 TRINITY_DN9952_c0_g1_i1:86-1501(+)